MHTISKFFTVLIIMMVLIPSTIAAPNENANPKAGLKIVDMSKGTMKEIKDDKVKGVKSSSVDIIVDGKGKNSIKMKDSKPSTDAKEHKKAKVSIPMAELQKIDVDKDGVFGILETANGVVISQRTATSAQIAAGIDLTFSEVEINGFSGYREETFVDVDSGDVLNIADASGDYTITVSTDGPIPTYVPGIPTSGLLAYYPLNGTANDFSGNGKHGTPTNMSYNSFGGVMNGKDSKIVTTLAAPAVPRTVALKWIPASVSIGSNLNTVALFSLNSLHVYQQTTLFRARGYNGTGVLTGNDIVVGENNFILTQTSTHISSKNNFGTPSTSSLINPTISGILTLGAGASTNATGQLADVVVYNRILNETEGKIWYAGGSGVSFQPQPSYNFTGYNVASGVEKIIDTDATCTGIEYYDTSGATRNVTVRAYYTDDTTISTQTSDASFHNISIVHNAGNTTTNGTIVMPIAPLYTGTAVLDSNNTNAVIAQNRTHFTVYTGTLTAADWFGYNVSVPNNADHGMWLDRLMQWVSGMGWNFVGTAPTDYADDISDEITVTVS